MEYTENQKKELYFANAIIGAINDLKNPMLMFQGEKDVVKKALEMYISKIKSEGNGMDLKVVLDEGAYMPTKAYEADAGFDIRTPSKVIIPPHSSRIIPTGVHIEIPFSYVGFLKSKSGLNMKDDILCEGVVDAKYTGSIVAKLYNHGNKEKVFERGDKITQIVILPIPDVSMVQVDSLEETERGNNGFGSSGR